MFTLQKHPKWMLFTVIMCWFCWRQNCPLHLVLNLWPSGDAHRLSDHCHLCARPLHKTPSPSVSFIQSADVLRQHYFCESNSVIRRSDSGARAMPPTWHMRLVSALAAAMPISSTEKDGLASPPTNNTCETPRRHTNTEPPLPSAEPDDGTGPERRVTVFFFLRVNVTNTMECF